MKICWDLLSVDEQAAEASEGSYHAVELQSVGDFNNLLKGCDAGASKKCYTNNKIGSRALELLKTFKM